MKYSFTFGALALASSAMAAYVPSEPWTTLTPEGLAAGAVTDYSNSFGIAIHTITSEVNVKAKREIATQIGDGQVQGTTSTGEQTIAPTTKATVSPTIKSTEAPTTKATATPTTEATEAPETKATTTSKSLYPSSVSFSGASHPDIVVTQIGDGQVQVANPTPTYIEIPTETTETTGGKTTVVSTTSKASYSSSTSYSYRSYSEVPSSSASSAGPVASEATCKSSGDLAMTLKAGVLTDAKGRIGAIVSNRQFQFDGPPPQAGSIYAAGWGIVDGHLTLGEDQIFWECLSGTFYNLYDQSLGDQCVPVYLNVIDLLDC